MRLNAQHLRQDNMVGFAMSFLSLAFGIGIAKVANFPLEAGIVSGLVGPLAHILRGGSISTIPGSAAALAPILAAAIATLGKGDYTLGLSRTLTVIVVTGVLMWIVGNRRKTKYFASYFTHPLSSGMLNAIVWGLTLSSLATLMMIKFENRTPLGIIKELANGRFLEANLMVVGVTLATLTVLILAKLGQKRYSFLKKYPPELWAIAFVFGLGLFLPLPEGSRVAISADLTAFHLWPDFDFVQMWKEGVFNDFCFAVATLFAVDTAESVANVMTTDNSYTPRRRSNFDKVVDAMGIANVVGGFLTGMSHIPGAAKGAIAAGLMMMTRWTLVFMVGYTLIWILAFREWINQIPLAGLSAIIIFSVAKHASLEAWQKARKLGRDQFLVYTATFVFSIFSGSIFKGLLSGIAAQLISVLVLLVRVARKQDGINGWIDTMRVIWKLWTDPLVEIFIDDNGVVHVHFTGTWAFFRPLDKVLSDIPSGAKSVVFHVGPNLHLMDHPTVEKLKDHCAARDGNALRICETLKSLSTHEAATRGRW